MRGKSFILSIFKRFKFFISVLENIFPRIFFFSPRKRHEVSNLVFDLPKTIFFSSSSLLFFFFVTSLS